MEIVRVHAVATVVANVALAVVVIALPHVRVIVVIHVLITALVLVKSSMAVQLLTLSI